MAIYICSNCGFSYDESIGVPQNDIPPGTVWSDLNESWSCPSCSVNKSIFKPKEEDTALKSDKADPLFEKISKILLPWLESKGCDFEISGTVLQTSDVISPKGFLGLVVYSSADICGEMFGRRPSIYFYPYASVMEVGVSLLYKRDISFSLWSHLLHYALDKIIEDYGFKGEDGRLKVKLDSIYERWYDEINNQKFIFKSMDQIDLVYNSGISAKPKKGKTAESFIIDLHKHSYDEQITKVR